MPLYESLPYMKTDERRRSGCVVHVKVSPIYQTEIINQNLGCRIVGVASCYTIFLRSAFDALSIGSGPVAAVSLCVNRELRFHSVS